MLDYCVEKQCRRRCISSHFGDYIHECKKSCDLCWGLNKF